MFYRSYSCLWDAKPIGIIKSNTNALLPESSEADQMKSISLTKVCALPLGVTGRRQWQLLMAFLSLSLIVVCGKSSTDKPF